MFEKRKHCKCIYWSGYYYYVNYLRNEFSVRNALAVIFSGLGFMAGNEIGAANGLSDLTGIPVAITGLTVGMIAIATVVCGTPKLLR